MSEIISEALRYLGCRNEPDEQTAALLSRGEKALLDGVAPAYCWLEAKKSEIGELLVGNDIEKHLDSCNRAILFAATLGARSEQLIRRAEAENMAYAVVLDALASAMIENFCDKCEKEIHERTGGYFTYRFSPGYGDYPLDLQGQFIRRLTADKRIGLTATSNSILIPRKSVTAIIGVSENEVAHGKRSCAVCNMRENCKYRKDGESCGY